MIFSYRFVLFSKALPARSLRRQQRSLFASNVGRYPILDDELTRWNPVSPRSYFIEGPFTIFTFLEDAKHL